MSQKGNLNNDFCDRMLENPSDESVVRWGNEGDSFVVLEVRQRGENYCTILIQKH